MERLLNPWKLAMLAAGSSSGYVEVSFLSGQRQMKAIVPSAELWVSVKDVLVLDDYEDAPGFELASLPRRATVVDAGAFVGLFSLKASSFAERVVAIEPSRRNFRNLERNLSINDVPNVEPRRAALAATEGSVALRESGTSSLVVPTGTADSETVESLPLGRLVDELGHIDLLKLDIEGAEYEVLLGAPPATLRRIDKIAGELHYFTESERAKASTMIGRLRDSGMIVGTGTNLSKGSFYGLTKPWRCSLVKVNGRSAAPYRMLVSAVYGLGPLAAPVRRKFDLGGGTSMLFAYRP